MAANAESRAWLLTGIAVLTLSLGVQLLWARRDVLAENPTWRPAIERLCLLASCHLAAWRQPEAFVPVRQKVTASPDLQGVLTVQVSFRNTARWPQPWPLIEIRLTDVNGTVLGLRRFRAKEYLNNRNVREIAPGQTVTVEIALQETSGTAAGFGFEFH